MRAVKTEKKNDKSEIVEALKALAKEKGISEELLFNAIEEALKLTNKAVMEALDGLPPVKVHCSVLAEQAIKAAIADYYKRQGIDPTPLVGEIPECEACCNL